MNEEQLQELLSVYRHRQSMPDLARQPRAAAVPWGWLVAAAAAMAVVVAMWPRNVLRPGETITTGSETRHLRLRGVGVIDIGPQTTLKLVESRTERKRLLLTVGTIHATTTSPPGIFVVDTPRARAVDLGCEYVLSIAPNGSGLLRVTSGWVMLNSFRESLVPRGARATIDSDGRIGPPVFEDSSPAFQAAIRRGNYEAAMPLARRRDALTLLNLFRMATPDQRLRIFDRLNELVPAPAGVTRESVRDWEAGTTERWWPDVLKASGVNAIKKKKGMLRGL